MGKIASIMIVLLLLLVVIPSESVEGESYAIYLQGYAYDSFDGNAVWHREGEYSGNITAIDINDPNMTPRGADDAINFGRVNEGKENEFRWDATPQEKEPHEWYSSPDKGNNIIFLGEYQHYDEKYNEYINYTWASNYIAEGKETPLTMEEHVVRYEPIPRPVLNEKYSEDPVGTTWINISIPHFKYTSSTLERKPTYRGSYDLLQSYAVFMRPEGEQKWKYMGNSRVDPNNKQTHGPIAAADEETNPNEINTGSQYFLAEDLKPGTGYEFMVRVNFRTLDEPVNGPVWGYGGGLGDKERDAVNNDLHSTDGGGSITPFGGSRGGGLIPTSESNPPSKPKNLVATEGNELVGLDWDEPDIEGSSPIIRYNIYRDGSYLSFVDSSSTAYTDFGVTKGVEYTYYVTAVNNEGEGSASDHDSAVPYGVPSEPQNFDASGDLNCIELNWDEPENDGGKPLTKYRIFRDGSHYTNLDVPVTSFTDDKVTNGTEYTYHVTAVNSVGESDPSNSDSASPFTSTNIEMKVSASSDGWGFISLTLIPKVTELDAILNDPTYGIDGSYDRVMYYDSEEGQWRSYVPDRADHFNDLDDWNHTMGIWVRMTENATLTVVGLEPVNTTITLYPGWNMVGYPSTITGNNGLPSEVTKIGYFDAGEEYNVAYVYSTTDFDFEPGRAYWIYNDEDHSLDWVIDY